jgi:ABC-type Fe3+-siderophore transport system permease subunit
MGAISPKNIASLLSKHKKILISITAFIFCVFLVWEILEVTVISNYLEGRILHYLYITRGIVMSVIGMIFVIYLLERAGKTISGIE